MTMAFPPGFRWGVSTAAHQIEGNNVNSDFWLLENIQPTCFTDRSGDACDSYHRYETDADLVAGLGLTSYRFSVEWARVEPSPGHYSTAELDHYARVCDALLSRGVEPCPTFFHASAPRWFAERGGWLDPTAPARFADYCARTTQAMGDRFGIAFTINEPQVGRSFRAFPASKAHFEAVDPVELAAHEAAARLSGVARFVTMNHPDIEAMQRPLMEAHAQALGAIKAVRGDLPVGVTLNITDFVAVNTDADPRAVRDGAYGDWMKHLASGRDDFVGVQVYRQLPVTGPGDRITLDPLPFADPTDPMSNLTRPEALRNAVSYVHEATGKPIVVSENGLETDNDAARVWYLEEALARLSDAVAEGVPVEGYFHWSLLDNFEWERGYRSRFGLYSVDRTSFARTPKPSAARYADLVRHFLTVG